MPMIVISYAGIKPGKTMGKARFRVELVKAQPSFLKPETGPKPKIHFVLKPELGLKA